jgi:hypothetical protein
MDTMPMAFTMKGKFEMTSIRNTLLALCLAVASAIPIAAAAADTSGATAIHAVSASTTSSCHRHCWWRHHHRHCR